MSLVLASCGSDFGRGFNSTDADQMMFFVGELDKSGIEYKKEEDGTIRYNSRDEARVKELLAKVNKRMSNVSAVKFEEIEATEYLKAVLSSKGYTFKETETKSGVMVTWYPENEEERNEIEMQVVQFVLDLKANREMPSNKPH